MIFFILLIVIVSICNDAFQITQDFNNLGQTTLHATNNINNDNEKNIRYYVPSDHLIVLSHGIMGSHKDLSYLSSKLELKGCIILQSKSNEFLKSLNGIKQGMLN